MKLIVGLGNPGEKYERTRHNAGFWLVERFAAQSGTVMRKDPKFQALVGRHSSSVWLLLPQSFMNASGRPVQMLAGFFKIEPAEILVVHDELDFSPGVAKIKQGGGIAGHNGLRDISARLGTHDYWRLRIGIGHPGERQAVTEYVLHKPGQEEHAAIDGAIARALEALPFVLAGDMQGAMLKLHTQPGQVKTPEPAVQRTSLKNLRELEHAATTELPPKAPKPEPVTQREPAPSTETAVETENIEQTGEIVKKRAFKSLFKKFLPESDGPRKK